MGVKRVAALWLAALVFVGLPSLGSPADDALQDGGDRLVEMQNPDGGWGWELTGPSAANTIGPIAMGLARGYWHTDDPSFMTALGLTGDFLLAKTAFSPSDGYLAMMLDSVFGGTTYRDHLRTSFYDKLAAGTYDRGGTLYDTAGYVNLIRTARANQGIGNLAAWDIGLGLVGAAACGADTAAWVAGTKAEINELDSSGYYDVIGLAGALYGLAFVGEEFNPTAGAHAAASSLADLADILAGYQIVGSGGFTWNANYLNPGEDNETVQETGYAILALNEVSRIKYLAALQDAADWLVGFQLATGGWGNYVGSSENNEVTAEAMWGIHALYLTYVLVGPGGTDSGFGYGAVPFATIGRAVSIIEGLGGTVYVAPGTYVEGPRVDIDGDVSIVGAGAGSTIVRPGGDTGTSGDSRAWFLVDPSATVYIEDIAFDGSGYKVYQGFRWKGEGVVVDCVFTDIQYNASGPEYNGVVIAAFENGNVDVIGCRFERIGRIGVLYFGANVAGALFAGNTYVGKGDGDWLDYGVELGAGARATVLFNEITGNRGVASVDGSESAGILVTDYYGPGTEATILYNVLRDNTMGIAVGYLSTDASAVIARYNVFEGNTWGVSSTGPIVDAALNWWGDPEGPMHASNPAGAGDRVSDSVIYSPWLGTSPDGDPLVPGVQITGPMLIIVAPVGPEPTGGYLNMAIAGANELPFADTIQVRHGTYDASRPITDPLTIISQAGSASNTFLTGDMTLGSAGIRVGQFGQGFTIMGNITVTGGVNASLVHINWNNLYGTVSNEGLGILDATYNWWAGRHPSNATIGLVSYDPFLPLPVDEVIGYMTLWGLSADETIALIVSLSEGPLTWDPRGVFGLTGEQLAALVSEYGWDMVLKALENSLTYEDFLNWLGGYGIAPAGGAGMFVDLGVAGGAGSFQGQTVDAIYEIGQPILVSFELLDFQGNPVLGIGAWVTLIQLHEDGHQTIWYWGATRYNPETGLQEISIPTAGLPAGYYNLGIGFRDGTQEQILIQIVVE